VKRATPRSDYFLAKQFQCKELWLKLILVKTML
jgi:hypothetical protein